MRLGPGRAAGGAPAVPLREAPTSRSSQKDDAQTEKPKGSQPASPSFQLGLERRHVGGDFHSNGDHFGFGLGPGHCELRKRVGETIVLP